MKHLFSLTLILMLTCLCTAFKNINNQIETEYEQFLNGKPLGFICMTSRGETEYIFQKAPNGSFKIHLYINGLRDGDLAFISTIVNQEIVIGNGWGEFEFYFKEGKLYKVIQEVYENKLHGIKTFRLQFNL